MQVDWKDDEKSPPSTDPKVAEAARKGWEETPAYLKDPSAFHNADRRRDNAQASKKA